MAITAPSNLFAVAASTSEIDLSWSPSITSGASVGDFGPGDFLSGDFVMSTGTPPTITGYQIFRDGLQIASIGIVVIFKDTGLQPLSTHSYFVKGIDSASEISSASNIAISTTLGAGSVIGQLSFLWPRLNVSPERKRTDSGFPLLPNRV